MREVRVRFGEACVASLARPNVFAVEGRLLHNLEYGYQGETCTKIQD